MSGVSVIMVSYFTGPSLWLAVDSVLCQPECEELIIINNGNPPGVEKLLNQRVMENKHLKIISGKGNIGFARACNLGAKSAKGDYLLFLNPDCMLPNDALAKSLAILKKYPEQTLAGCNLRNPDGSEQRGGRRSLLTPANALAESLGCSFLLPKSDRLNHHKAAIPEQAHEVSAISGAFMLISRNYYNQLKGLDEGYFLHMEDMDFCYRVKKSGGRIICMPEVSVLHFHSTSEAPSSKVEYFKTLGFVRYFKTHYGNQNARAMVSVLIPLIWLRYYMKFVFGGLKSTFKPPLEGKRNTSRLVALNRIFTTTQPNSSLVGKTVLITGASGQLGCLLLGYVLQCGARVIALTNHTKVHFTHPNLTWTQYDLEKDKTIMRGSAIDIVIHAAEFSLLLPFIDDLCDGGTSRVIAFSCANVAEMESSRRVVAKNSKAILQNDREQKLLASCKSKACDCTIFSLAGMYGLGIDNSITAQADVIRRYGKMAIFAPGNGLRQPVHVQDIALAVMSSLLNANTFGKVYGLAGGSKLTYRQMMEQLFIYMGRKPHFTHIPHAVKLLNVLAKIYSLKNINGHILEQMNRDIVIDDSAARQDIGFNPRSFLEGEAGL